MDKNNITSVKIPAGAFCGHNCSDGCVYWNPYDRDSNGRQYCSHYDAYYSVSYTHLTLPTKA